MKRSVNDFANLKREKDEAVYNVGIRYVEYILIYNTIRLLNRYCFSYIVFLTLHITERAALLRS